MCHVGNDQLISHYCREYASVNWLNIASGNGFARDKRQAITLTNAALLPIGALGTSISEIRIDAK